VLPSSMLLNGTVSSPNRKQLNISPLSRLVLSVLLSLLLLYHGPLQWRHEAQAGRVRYPVSDPELLAMAEEDMGAWSGRGSNNNTDGNGSIVTYTIPDVAELAKINPYLSVIRFSTRTGVEFLNGNSFDHLRMLWFGCSLHRMLQFARVHKLHVDTIFVLNVGDDWVEGPEFPVWSKGRKAEPSEPSLSSSMTERIDPPLGVATSKSRPRDIMIPYEELLWSYRPRLMSIAPFASKERRVVFRGGCTHPHRRHMVREVREALEPNQADVQVGCDPDFKPLTSTEQAQYRCLLDYDGVSYSRRTAWYLETASVILRGGVIDDVLSRLGRRRQQQQQEQKKPDRASSTKPRNVEASQSSLPPPIVFWRDDELIPAVQRCLADDEGSELRSRSAAEFWNRYVRDGQAVWEGYMLHLLVEQPQRFAMVLPSTAIKNDRASSSSSAYPIFTRLSTTLVCPLIQDGAVPTGESGELQWRFILVATIVTVLVIFGTHRWVVPLLLFQLLYPIWTLTARTAVAIFAVMSNRQHAKVPLHAVVPHVHKSQPSSAASKPSPTRSIMQFLAQQNWMMRDSSPTHEREE
jgi:biotin carboxyl carrier protein